MTDRPDNLRNTGDLERAEAVLEGNGEMFRSRVDPNGARMVKGVPPLHQAP